MKKQDVEFIRAGQIFALELKKRLVAMSKMKYVDAPNNIRWKGKKKLKDANLLDLQKCHELQCLAPYICRAKNKAQCLEKEFEQRNSDQVFLPYCAELHALQNQAGFEPLSCPLTWETVPENPSFEKKKIGGSRTFEDWKNVYQQVHPVQETSREIPPALAYPIWTHVRKPSIPVQDETKEVLIPHYQEHAFRTLEGKLRAKDPWNEYQTGHFLTLYRLLEAARMSRNPQEEFNRIKANLKPAFSAHPTCGVHCKNPSCHWKATRKWFSPWKTERKCVPKDKNVQVRASIKSLEKACSKKELSLPLCDKDKVNWLNSKDPMHVR